MSKPDSGMEDPEFTQGIDDPRPKLIKNVGFWIWQMACWFFWALVTLVYLPWALAMHIVIGVFALVFSVACCWRRGRQVFLYIYVVSVMLPGKFLWFNFFQLNRRRGRVWDFEMGKPRPIPLQDRRRVSVSDHTLIQTSSPLFSKLPAEIRMRIYREVLVGDADWFNIIEGSTSKPFKDPKKKPKRDFKAVAYPCTWREYVLDEPGLEEEGIRSLHRVPHIRRDVTRKSGGPALLRTCRLIYKESIDLLYTQPTFNFIDLHKPPFFITGALPQRLARIRNVHLVYDQNKMVKRTQHSGCSTARYWHRVGECTFCNTIHWLNGMKKHMTNLQNIEAFIFLEKKREMLKVNEAWIQRLFDLQLGPNGLRKLKLHVSPMRREPRGYDVSPLAGEDEFYKKVRDFDRLMQKKLDQGIRSYHDHRKRTDSDTVIDAPTRPEPVLTIGFHGQATQPVTRDVP